VNLQAGQHMTTTLNQKEQITQSRRMTILAAATEIFVQKGFEKTTMAEIARKAGVAVGTIYQFFPSKESLHMALLEDRAAQLLAHVEGTEYPTTSVDDGLQKLTGSDLLFDEDYPQLLAGKTPDRKQRELQEKRNAILAAAAQAFQEKGLHTTSMADIAERSGVAKGTLYNFFASKEELYFTLIEEKLHAFFLYVQDEVNQVAQPVAKIMRMIHAECAFFEANRAFFRIFVSTRSGLESTAQQDLGERVHQRYGIYLDWVAELIQAGIEAGELKPAHPKEMAQALIGMLNAILFEWTVAPALPGTQSGSGDAAEQSLVAKAPRIAELFLHGAQVKG
jgi:AcrR family transcriptional regulator